MAQSANGLGAPPQPVMRGFVRDDPLSQPASAELPSLGGQPAVAGRAGGVLGQVDRQASTGSNSAVPDAELLVLLGQGRRTHHRARIPGMGEAGTGSGSAASVASDQGQQSRRRHTFDRGADSEQCLSDPLQSLSDDMVAARGLNRNGGARGNGEARKGDGGWSGIGISRAAIPQGTGGHSPSGFLTSDSDNKRAVAGRSLLSSSEEQKRPIRAGMLNSGADSSGPHSGTRVSVAQSVESVHASRMPRSTSITGPPTVQSHQGPMQDPSFGLSPTTHSSHGSRPPSGVGSTTGMHEYRGQQPGLVGQVGARAHLATAAAAAGVGSGPVPPLAPSGSMQAPLSRSRSSFAGDGAIRLGGDVPGPSETCWQPSVVTSVDMLARAGAGSFQGSSVVPTAASDPMAALNTPRWAWAPPPPPDAYRGLYVPTPPASAPASQRLSGAPGGWSSLPPSWYPAPGMPPQHAAFSQAPLAATSALAPEAQKHSPLGSAGGGDARGLGGAQYGGVPSAAAPRPPGMMPPPSHAQPSFSGHPLVAPRPPPPPQDYQFAHYAPPSGAPYGQQGQPSHSQPAWSHPPVGQLRAYASVDEGQSPMWQRSVMGGMTPGAPTPTALGGSSLLGSSMLSPHAGQQQAYTMGSVPVIPASPAAQLQHGGMESPAHAMGFTPMAGASMWRHPLSVPGMGYAPAAMSQGSFATSPAASADLARLSSSMALSVSAPSSLAIPAVSVGGAATATLSDGSTMGSLLPFDSTPHRMAGGPRGLGAVAAAAVAAEAHGMPNPPMSMPAPGPGQMVLDSPFGGISMLGDPTPRAPSGTFLGPPSLAAQPHSVVGLGVNVRVAGTPRASGQPASTAAVFPASSPVSASGSQSGLLSGQPLDRLASTALLAPPGTLALPLAEPEPSAKRAKPGSAASPAAEAWQRRPEDEPDFTRPLQASATDAHPDSTGAPEPPTPASTGAAASAEVSPRAKASAPAAKSSRAPKRKRAGDKAATKWKCPHCESSAFASFAQLASHLRDEQ